MNINALKAQLGHSVSSVRRFLERPIGLRASRPPPQAQARSARAQERERVRKMRRELYELMQRHPDSRQLMRHLDLVERTLRRQGLAGVEALPVRVLATALAQLERLVWDWTAEGLAELRSRLSVIVKHREAQAADAAAPLMRDTLVPQAIDLAEVDDNDLAQFREMERSWVGRMPEPVAAKAPGGN